MFNNSSSQARVDQGINLPDYFSCHNCAAKPWEGQKCDEFQRAGRCRAEMLGQALKSGAVQVVLFLPQGK